MGPARLAVRNRLHLPIRALAPGPARIGQGAGTVSWALLTGVQGVASDAALLLLVGGLSMLSLIVVLVILQNLFPDRSEGAGLAPQTVGRELRPLEAAPLPPTVRKLPGSRFGRPRPLPRGAPIDLALGRIVERRLGEPRLLRCLEDFTLLRLYGCPGCLADTMDDPGVDAPDGCHGEAQALSDVFRGVYGDRVVVRESACCRRGDSGCDFEVRH